MTKKRAAAYTRCWDEPHHMWLWLQHYVSAVGADNCYVMRGAAAGDRYEEMHAAYPGVNWFSDDHPDDRRGDEYWHLDRMKAYNDRLLQDYDVVVMGDTDELLVPVDGSSLSAWLDGFRASGRRYAKATGYNVFEDMDQRGTVVRWRCTPYDKTSVTTVPLVYRIGFHQAWDLPERGDNSNCTIDTVHDLDLAHLQYCNFDVYVSKCQRKAAYPGIERDVTFPCADPRIAEHLFRTGIPLWAPDHKTYAEMRKYPREPVPEHWVGLTDIH